MDYHQRIEALKEALESLKNEIEDYPSLETLKNQRKEYVLLMALEDYLEYT